jgi:hypothetical protein
MTDVNVFEDGFTGEVGTVVLESHTPDVTGTAWTVDAGNSGSVDFRIEGASETHVEASGSVSAGHYAVYYIAPALPSADGQIELEIKTIVNTSGADDHVTLLVARRQADENAYVLRIGGNSKVQIYHRTAAETGTVLDEAFVEYLDGDRWRLRCHGTSITAHHKPSGGAWVQVAEAIDSGVTLSGEWGIGTGEYVVSNDNIDSFIKYDQVLADDVQADVGNTGTITQTLVGFSQVVEADNEASNIVIFDDTFTEGSDTLIEDHTPDVGTAWVYDTENTALVAEMEILSATNFIWADTIDGSDSLIAFATPVASLGTPNINLDVVVEALASGAADYVSLVARRQTDGTALVCNFTDTECFVKWRSTASPTGNIIGAVDWVLAIGDTVRFRVFGEVIMVLKKPAGGVFEAVFEYTQSIVQDSGQFGFGFGDYADSTGRIHTDWRISRFTATEIVDSSFNTLMFYDNFPTNGSETELVDHTPDHIGGGWVIDADNSGATSVVHKIHYQESEVYSAVSGFDTGVYLGELAYPVLDVPDVMMETQITTYRNRAGPSPGLGAWVFMLRRQAGGEAYVLELFATADGELQAYIKHRAPSSGGSRVVTTLASFWSAQWVKSDIWRFTADGPLLTVDLRESNGKAADGYGGVFERVMSVEDTRITTGGQIGLGAGEYVTIPADIGSSGFNNGWHINYVKYAALAHEEARAVAITASVPIQTILLSLENADIRCGVLSVIIPGQMGVLAEISADGPGFLASIGETGVIS